MWLARRVFGEIMSTLKAQGIRISLFIDPEPKQISASAALGADIVELHTGPIAMPMRMATNADGKDEIERLQSARYWPRKPV